MTALTTIRPAGDLTTAREQQIGTALERLAAASGATLREAVKDVPSFAKVLEGLVGDDERWQRSSAPGHLRTHPPPRALSSDVPSRLGLRTLHLLLHDEGAEPAINMVRGVDVPSWADLIRVYRPGTAKAPGSAGGGTQAPGAARTGTVDGRHASHCRALRRMEAARYAAAVARVAGSLTATSSPIEVLDGLLKEPT